MTRFTGALVVTAILAPSGVSAQQPARSVRLQIVVRDPSGAIIPNAAVTIVGSETRTAAVAGQAAATDSHGIATIDALSTGRYSVTVSFPGFETRTLTDVRVRAGDNHREVTLAIARVAESVAVGRDAE
ncbi:MAG TPA: carboxypeptidase-like regulatory domain-containing protein, partial [Vicinamibacterales bacterium]